MNEEEKKAQANTNPDEPTDGDAGKDKATAGTETTPETEAVPEAEPGTKAGQEQDSAEQSSPDSSAQSGENEKPEEPPAEPDWKDRYARTLADFDNYRKRMARDRDELAQFAAKDILKDILPTVDNLALALEKAENKEDPFVQGVKLAYDGFLKALADHGATPIDSVGEPFDANYHEALAQLPSADVAEGVVMNEVKRGWLLHGKLLRAAQVVVSSGTPEAPAEA